MRKDKQSDLVVEALVSWTSVGTPDPGVPMICAGDEIALAAMGSEYAPIPMPWAHPERWDQQRLATTRALFGARARNVALRRGGRCAHSFKA